MSHKGFSDHFLMVDGRAKMHIHPDCILRGGEQARRDAKLRRQRNATALRSFANTFRLQNVTDESARTVINAHFRGRVARDERSVFSWLDATKLPVEYIESHNTIIADEFASIFSDRGLDVSAILVQPLLPVPTIDSSTGAIQQYNAQALECAKNFLRYECIRTRPVTNSMRVAIGASQ